MRYCVIKNTTTIIDGSLNADDVMLQNAKNAGFSENQVEILTGEQYGARKALEPKPVPLPSEIEVLSNYVLDVDMRLIMVELGM